MDSNYELITLPTGMPTLNRWFEVWMDSYKKGRLKPTTIDTYNALYDRHIRSTVGDHLLNEFHPVHIQKLYNDFLKKGYSAKYLSTLHAMLNNIFKTALANELIQSNPCSLTDRPGIESVERRVLTIDEQRALMNFIMRPRYRHIEPAFTTMLGTGLRIGELLGLSWSDICIAGERPEGVGLPEPVSYLTVRRTLVRVKNVSTDGSHYLLQSPKTKCSNRSIPLQRSVIDALRRQYELQLEYKERPSWNPISGFEGLVFCGRNGQPHWRSTIVANIKTVVDSYNKEQFSNPAYINRILPHDLRHTFATRCLEAGIPPKVVQHWLGHASIKMTLDLYTHVNRDLSARYMHILEATISPESEDELVGYHT